MYSILPHKFREVMDRIDAHITEYTATGGGPKSAKCTVGEAPRVVVEKIKMAIFDEMRPGMEKMGVALNEFVRRNPELFDMQGAPLRKGQL